jgi:hypothetical protein
MQTQGRGKHQVRPVGSRRYAEQTSVLKRAAISATTFISVSAGLPSSAARFEISSSVRTRWASVFASIDSRIGFIGIPSPFVGVCEKTLEMETRPRACHPALERRSASGEITRRKNN